ncbi:MAG: PQQ-dependent sugar dehydrogenase [Bacteroidetes bacterium]|nr:PQQ-dependent sugar dehydrogenase [Bacteroidota bacterium]
MTKAPLNTIPFRFVLLHGFILIALGNMLSQTFPPGFSQVKVGDIYYPTSMDFAPDGRIFCTEKAGKVKIIKNGVVLSTVFLSLPVDQLGERGLSSIAIDPNFNTNQYVYIYYTTAAAPIHNRLSRFTASGDVAVPGSEMILLDFEPLVNSIHNSGGMVFGTDGKLYLAVGNDNVNSNSQDLTNYKGKIIRINTDGSVPAGNPFTGNAAQQRIWAYGFRNPWTLAIQPGTGKIFANDVGEASWEEINDITVSGKNFGWPAAEGMSSNPAYKNPVYTYPHGSTGFSDGCAITGGTFFNPSSTNYPAQYAGKYFFIDYCNNWINYLDLSNGVTNYNFATGLTGSENYIKTGPDGNLYYFSIGPHALYKIIYSNTTAPVITSQPASQSVSQGQPVTFQVSASGASPLTYQWQKNTVNISGANSPGYTINNVQSANAGSYRAVVTNGFGSATSNQATLTVTGFNSVPNATIFTPPAGTLYRGGDIISFSGDATDAEDGTLPATAFQWYVEFHHDQHIHPGPFIPAGVKSGTFAISNTGEASANVYLRSFLVVTDSQGAKDTVFTDILPKKSTITLTSQPNGLQLLLDDQPHVTTYSVLAVSGMKRPLGVIAQQTLSGTVYSFDHWVHGGSASQTITVTDNNATFTAVFVPTGTVANCSASGSILREYWANIYASSLSQVPFNTTPSSTSQVTLFQGPSNLADNYASRIRGYICPPASGNYTFWIASDNNSELWLSTNDQPSGKIKIAYVNGYTMSHEYTKYATQQSAPVNLVAGTRYYIEAIHLEGTQGDNLSVGWRLPDGTLERPIPGNRLSPFTGGQGSANDISVSITSPANNTSFSSPANIGITASASTTSGSISKVEFFWDASKIGESLSAPYFMTWMNVNTGNYVIKAVATDNMSQSKTSQTVNIIVTGCITPTITPSGPTTFCSGSLTLNTAASAGNSYQWKKDGTAIPGATASSFVASSSGDYQIKVTNGSCVGYSAPLKITVDNSLKARITPGGPLEFCSGSQVMLYANTCGNYYYQWKKNGADIPGANSFTYVATTTANYQVKIIQGSSVVWSALVTTTVNNCPGAKAMNGDSTSTIKPSEAFHISVYPNPTTGLFSFDFCIEETQHEIMEIKVLSSTGEEVYSRPPVYVSGCVKEKIDLPSSLTTGVYILQLRIGNRLENTKLILSNGK